MTSAVRRLLEGLSGHHTVGGVHVTVAFPSAYDALTAVGAAGAGLLVVGRRPHGTRASRQRSRRTNRRRRIRVPQVQPHVPGGGRRESQHRRTGADPGVLAADVDRERGTTSVQDPSSNIGQLSPYVLLVDSAASVTLPSLKHLEQAQGVELADAFEIDDDERPVPRSARCRRSTRAGTQAGEPIRVVLGVTGSHRIWSNIHDFEQSGSRTPARR